MDVSCAIGRILSSGVSENPKNSGLSKVKIYLSLTGKSR
jgi:hypothetical protein